MQNFTIVITVELPYPKTFEYRESASSVAPAVSRAMKRLRKDIGKKKVKKWILTVLKM